MHIHATPPECWLAVVDFEGFYEVSCLGRVKTLRTSPKAKPGAILKATLTRGRKQVKLYRNGAQHSRPCHVLVAAAFLGPRPGKLGIDHVNGDKTDNAAMNLEYVTGRENLLRAVRLGLIPIGDDRSHTKLTKHQAAEIIALRGIATIQELGVRFGVSPSQVSRIQRGREWKHLARPAMLPNPREHPRGEANPCSKLTEADAAWIRSMRGQLAGAEIARRLRIGKSTVCRIQLGRAWQHVDA